jgi:hypothetical protein
LELYSPNLALMPVPVLVRRLVPGKQERRPVRRMPV